MWRWRTRDWLLVGSIAANLLLAGFVVGGRLGAAPPGGPPGPPPRELSGDFDLRALLSVLSPEEREQVRETVLGEGERARSGGLFRELRDARKDFVGVVTADQFDAESARASSARLREAEGRLDKRGDELMIQILADLPPDERVRVIADMRERGQRFREGPGGPGGRPDGPGRGPRGDGERGARP